VKFHGRLGESYVTASPAQVNAAVRQFLYVKKDRGALAEQQKRDPNARREGKQKRAAGAVKLIDASDASRAQADLASPRVGFPVYYPRKLVPGSSFAQDAPRAYTIETPGGDRNRAYKMVVFTGFLGEYYGVQGTSWKNPPILSSPSEERKIGGRKYLLFYNGDRLRLVAWKTRRGSYWISNTLLQTLSEREMLGVARSLARAG
jgi:hypothetical protein